MILLTAVLAGLLVGLIRAKWQHTIWQPPDLRHTWLVLVAFLPQLFVFYLPTSYTYVPDTLVAACLIGSQIGLLSFCLLNRHHTGILVLATGLLLNLLVITTNGGLMPLSTETAAQLIPANRLQHIALGERIGPNSKDVLLPSNEIVFSWLADRFLPPDGFPYRFAFSIGDVFIGLGAFLLLSLQPNSPKDWQKGHSSHVSRPGHPQPNDSSQDTFGVNRN